MSTRAIHAKICQEGASNERKVAACLVEAIDECRAENVNPSGDPAVFLILHHLVHLLTLQSLCSYERWEVAVKELGIEL